MPAPVQITAEQLLREAKERELELVQPVLLNAYICVHTKLLIIFVDDKVYAYVLAVAKILAFFVITGYIFGYALV